MGEKQVNYLEKIREAFGCADIDVDERVKNVNIHLSVAPSSLPNEAGLRGLISLFPEQDSLPTTNTNCFAGKTMMLMFLYYEN